MDYLVQDTSLAAVADAIRAKTGGADALAFPEGMVEAIVGISGGGSGGNTDMEDLLVGGVGKESITEYSNERVTVIRPYMFQEFGGLQAVDLPNVETVGTYAFNGCQKLPEIYLPKCKAVGANSFQVCRALEKANLPLAETIDSYAFSNNSKLYDVSAPLVTNIQRQGFYMCAALKKLDFHQLNTIAMYSFTNSSKFDTLIIRTENVCTLDNVNALTGTAIANKTGYVYVPSALVDSYKAATNWSTYADQIRAIEDYPEITGGAT